MTRPKLPGSRTNFPTARGRSGAIAAGFALLVAPVILAAGGATDYSRAALLQTDLQSIADNAARAAAAVYDGSPQSGPRAAYLARAYVTAAEHQLSAHAGMDAAVTQGLTDTGNEVAVTLTTAMPTTFFGRFMPRVTLTARAVAPGRAVSIARTAGTVQAVSLD